MSAAPPSELAERLAPLDTQWNREVEAFAIKSESLQRPDLAARCRALLVDRSTRSSKVYLAPRDAPKAPVVDAVEQSWRRHLGTLQASRAEQLLEVARGAAKAHPAWALQLCYEAVNLSPQWGPARQVLGYRRDAKGQWQRDGFYGQAPEFHRGIRATVVKQSANARMGLLPHWRIRTPHFEILAESSQESGERLATEVEAVFDVWAQLFTSLWIDGDTLQRRLKSGAAATPPLRRHRVVLFRDRQRYLDELQKKEPRIQITVGYYRPDDKTSYFYWEPNQPPIKTWRHEVAHQLFAEVRRSAPQAGLRQNFWLMEGIAMYMESLRVQDNACFVGGPGVDRLQFARLRQSPDAASLQPLVSMGRVAMQGNPELSKLYSSAAGVACFLMDGEGGRHRKACTELLLLVYQGRDRANSLFATTGIAGADEFASRYLAFLNTFDDNDLADLGSVENLCLRYTQVTGEGLRQVKPQSLVWLDVAGRPYTDADLLPLLSEARQLKQLNLEATRITDDLFATGRLTQRWPALIELDLSQTRVTDAAVKQIGELPLEVLWLTKSAASPKSLEILQRMKSLKTIDLEGVPGITPAMVGQLKSRLPNLTD